jgi:DNA modification methylase
MIALQDDGWILRNKIVWHKPNAMPESVGDRFTTSWELIMLLAKSRIYDFHLDNVRIPHKQSTLKDLARRNVRTYSDNVDRPYRAQQNGRTRESFLHSRGKNPGDVWRVMVRPSTLPHFAAYPVKLVEKIIKAGTEEGEIVLDPFVGSGTTTMVARKLRRRFIGVDIKEDYCEIARQRTRGGKYRPSDGSTTLTIRGPL